MAAGEFDIDFFHDSGFVRKQCNVCSSYFWTEDSGRQSCGDPACDGYSFINRSPVYKKYTLDEMRAEFIKFFENDPSFHHRFLEPYPVVPRWRNDVLLVNASIYDFQPQVTSGMVPPPGNPIVMSQPSIRMLDLDLVGKTGRHLTSFEMLCHDAFNYENKFIYWMNETIEYSYRFLTEKLMVKPELITYKEKPWFGGGNAGNAVEVFVGGLEVATLVFMDMKEDPDGDIEIDGTKYSKMPIRIVDTGYGLERLVWLSQATPTVYDSIYGKTMKYIIEKSVAVEMDSSIIQKISEISAKIEPYSDKEVMSQLRTWMNGSENRIDSAFMHKLKMLRNAYSLADHTRTLLLMFSDYVIPSNVKVGYLARTLIRRSLKFMDELSFAGTFLDILEFQHEEFKNLIKNFDLKFIENIISIEIEKYNEVNRSALSRVKRYIKNDVLSDSDIVKLYESDGLNEDLISETFARITGKELLIPDDFHEMLISRHEKIDRKKKEIEEYPDINTRPLYYDNTKIKEFTAIALYSCGNKMIPNQTAFYPEGGGQPYDLGYFIANGKKFNVTGVQKYGKAIVHFIDGEINKGARIKGFIDYSRRRQLMIHHSATHLLLGILREYFGDHVWQSGVRKEVDDSRLDITHYNKITGEDIKNIENLCLKAIEENRKITVVNMNWNPAIEKYGFRLFEGGVPVSPKIRIVTVDGIDSEGCGGTHLDNTLEIGFIKIIRTEVLQEGIQRIIFSAGPAALRYVEKLYDTVTGQQEFLKADLPDLLDYSRNILSENIELKKSVDRYIREKIDLIIANGTEVNGIKLYFSALGQNEMNILLSSLFKLPGRKAVINNGTELYLISMDDAVDNAIAGIIDNGITVAEKIRNKKIYSAILSAVISEKLIKVILDNIKNE
ncbi:MAG: alanine--tRNA ligase [Ferroplasma sp.]